MGMYSYATNQYQQVKVQTGVQAADPHRLVSMLLEGAQQRITAAKVRIEHRAVAEKGQLIGNAIAIIDSLRASLDAEKGGEIAENLDRLYDYMSRRLFEANLKNDTAILDEVAGLLHSLEEAWAAIAPSSQAAGPGEVQASISAGI